MLRTDLARTRGRTAILTLAIVSLILCITTSVSIAQPGAHATKRHSLRVDDQASLHKTSKNGSTIYESGTATGTLPGSVTAVFNTSKVTKVTGTVTFHSRRGSITMTVVGYPQSTGTVARFSGSIAVRSGTGRYDDALGSGTFSGTVNRRSWAVSVHAVANVTY